ncbi:MAG: hypothetical protein HYW27_04490 [Candidatus Aenigmarchaeota archaeon]|nr:hypothetical protein [Candidatus Aenigmarchaeota archaeon]
MDRLKIYLDTNTVLDFFINEARVIKNNEDTKVPSKFQFMLESKEKIEFVSSFLTKAEICRELVSAFQLSEEDIERLWNTFISSLECRYIERFQFDEEIVKLTIKLKMRLRTMVNFFHLFIAIKDNAYLLSGDKDLIRIVRENLLYDKIISYIELRNMSI